MERDLGAYGLGGSRDFGMMREKQNQPGDIARDRIERKMRETQRELGFGFVRGLARRRLSNLVLD